MHGCGVGNKDESWGFGCDGWPEVPFKVMGRWGRKCCLGCGKPLPSGAPLDFPVDGWRRGRLCRPGAQVMSPLQIFHSSSPSGWFLKREVRRACREI